MNTTDNKSKSLRAIISAYVAGIIVSYGPAAVSIQKSCPPGPRYEERVSAAIPLAIFPAAAWPLYWSYRIADRP